MIELTEGLPDGVIGLAAVGEVSSEDYATVANPAVEQALERHDKIRLLHVLDDRFTGYTAGGMWDDAKLGLAHPRSWERIAVVTDDRSLVNFGQLGRSRSRSMRATREPDHALLHPGTA